MGRWKKNTVSPNVPWASMNKLQYIFHPLEPRCTFAYQLYIAKTIQHIGITAHTRPIYERAIAGLEDSPAAKICGEYAKMEASLHEIDRARTAYVYGAQLADPRRNPEYWGEWHEFEVSHGNEETFCEMLRVKRGVQAAFSTVNYNAVEMGGSGPGSGGDGMRLKNGDADTPLTDEQAIAMLAAQEGVEGDMDMSMVIGGGNGNNDE